MLAVAFACSAGTSLRAETSTYYGLKTVNPVQDRNNDKAFWDASTRGPGEGQTFLSSVKHLVHSNKLPQTIANTWKPLDATKFTLAEAYGVRAYFVGEDTNYSNSLGFNTTGHGVDSGNPLLIFPNASTAVDYNKADSNELASELRTPSEPLFPGDFVDLGSSGGTLAKGTNLDFFMIQNGQNTLPGVGLPPNVLSAASGNLVAFAQANNPYVLIGFEDGTGRVDFSDALFAIDMGVNNVNFLLGGSNHPSGVPAPEPGVTWALVLGVGAVLQRIRRKRTAAKATVA